MTLEEAHMILNVNKGEAMEKVLEVCVTRPVLLLRLISYCPSAL